MRFSGSYTGQRIATTLKDELESAGINEIDFIISDNASNMRSAFTTTFSMPNRPLSHIMQATLTIALIITIMTYF